MVSDRNFDDLAGRFARNIYQNPKGEIRLRLVEDELFSACPALRAGKSLRILDAGCGMGQLTALLAKQGHEVVCCDLSAVMLEEAQQELVRKAPECQGRVQFIHGSVQDLPKHISGTFDLVIFHAVLEWLANPHEGLLAVLPWLKSDGVLSMMFYNAQGLIFKNLLRGNFEKIRERDFRGDPGSLTPLNALDPAEVERWLHEAGLQVFAKRGIRAFYDYMDQTMGRTKAVRTTDEIFQMEKEFGAIEPYRSLARYILLHVRKKMT